MVAAEVAVAVFVRLTDLAVLVAVVVMVENVLSAVLMAVEEEVEEEVVDIEAKVLSEKPYTVLYDDLDEIDECSTISNQRTNRQQCWNESCNEGEER
jgi:hypothetical protein